MKVKMTFKKEICTDCNGEGDCHTSHSWTCPHCNGQGFLINGQKWICPNGSSEYREEAFKKWEKTGKNSGDSKEYKLQKKEWKRKEAERRKQWERGKVKLKKLQKELVARGISFKMERGDWLVISPRDMEN